MRRAAKRDDTGYILSVDPSTDESKVGWAYYAKGLLVHGHGYHDSIHGIVMGQGRPELLRIIVEDQFYPIWRPMQLQTFNNIKNLARHAGRWLQIAEDYGIGIENVHYVLPEDWMMQQLGALYKGKAQVEKMRQAVTAHHPETRKARLSEHVLAAICIGDYWRLKDWGVK